MSIVLTATNKSPLNGDFFAKKSSKKADNTFALEDLFIYSERDGSVFRPATFTVVVGTEKEAHGIAVIPPHIQLMNKKQ